jgi:hypothetical protein
MQSAFGAPWIDVIVSLTITLTAVFLFIGLLAASAGPRPADLEDRRVSRFPRRHADHATVTTGARA